MTWGINLGDHPSLASNSWVSLFTKFEALSDDMTVAIPVCINKSMIASHTFLASNLFSGYSRPSPEAIYDTETVLMAIRRWWVNGPDTVHSYVLEGEFSSGYLGYGHAVGSKFTHALLA